MRIPAFFAESLASATPPCWGIEQRRGITRPRSTRYAEMIPARFARCQSNPGCPEINFPRSETTFLTSFARWNSRRPAGAWACAGARAGERVASVSLLNSAVVSFVSPLLGMRIPASAGISRHHGLFLSGWRASRAGRSSFIRDFVMYACAPTREAARAVSSDSCSVRTMT